MLINDNAYGAPWNDQFYWVTYVNEDGQEYTEQLVLSGPKDYFPEELMENAEAMFPNVSILNVESDEIYR